MNEEERNSYREEDISAALNDFKQSLITGRKKYFDVSEFEGIVEQLLEEGDIKSSEIAILQGIQMHPNSVELQLKYAQILLNKGKIEETLKHLKLVEKVETKNPDVYLIKGTAWLMLGENEKAEKAFLHAEKFADSELDDILYHIGGAHVQTGDIEKAIEYFEKSVLNNPKNETALFELGFFSDQLGEFEKSINYYNRFLDLDPYNYTMWFNLGISYNKSGNFEKAIDAYEYTLAINEEFYQALFNIGNAYANLGNFKKAINKYYEYLEIYPENDDAWCYIGECYLNLENYTKSEQHYQKAIEINKDNDTAWFGAGLVMWVEKKYIESIVFIKKAIKIDNTNSEYWLTLGKVYNSHNNPDEALKTIKKAARLEPENSEIWLTWVDTYLQNGEQQKAIKILELGIKKNDNADLKYRMVSLLLEMKKETEGLEMLKKAMVKDFSVLDFLYDVYPKAAKNRRLKRLIDEFRKNNMMNQEPGIPDVSF